MTGTDAASDGVSGRSATNRECGACSLCCVVLRVDELRKAAGVPCPQLRPTGSGGSHQTGSGGGCQIHSTRPEICRAYRCLWLRGGLEEADRPDRLGAVLDVINTGPTPQLSIQEAHAGAIDESERLRAIAERYRASMPVRIVEAGAFDDPDRPFRVLLPGGEEHRVRGERVEHWIDGQRIDERRLPFLERLARRLAIALRRRKVARTRNGPN